MRISARFQPGDDSRAQATIEYAFLIILVGAICLAILAVAGHQVQNVFHNVSDAMLRPGATPTPAPLDIK